MRGDKTTDGYTCCLDCLSACVGSFEKWADGYIKRPKGGFKCYITGKGLIGNSLNRWVPSNCPKINKPINISRMKLDLYEKALLEIKNMADNIDPDGHFDNAFYGVEEIVKKALDKGKLLGDHKFKTGGK